MSFADRWKEAGEAADEYDPDDGPYTAKVIDVGAFTARTSGNDIVKLTWQIIGGDDAGRRFDDIGGISNPTGLRITREKLGMLGLSEDIQPETIEDLEAAMDPLIGIVADIAVSHSGGFRNVKVGRVKTGQSDIPNPTDDFKTAPMADGNGGKQPTFEEMVGKAADADDAAAGDDDPIPY